MYAGARHDVCDAVVNDGKVEGIRFLQRALGVPDDGGIGPVTLAALEAETDLFALRCRVLAEDTRYHFLALHAHPEDTKYADGWGTRLFGKITRLPVSGTAQA